MNGATISRASQARSAKEAMTMPASHAPAGTARSRSPTKLDLGEPTRELLRLRGIGGDPDLGAGGRAVAGTPVRDSLAAGRELEGGDVAIGDAAEVVLPACELAGPLTHARAQVRPRREQLERRLDRLALGRVDRHLDRDVVGQL